MSKVAVLPALMVWAALCALTTGCTVTTGGTVVAAATLGRAPQPVPVSALSGLLLTPTEIGAIMASRMEVVDSSDAMYTNRPSMMDAWCGLKLRTTPTRAVVGARCACRSSRTTAIEPTTSPIRRS